MTEEIELERLQAERAKLDAKIEDLYQTNRAKAIELAKEQIEKYKLTAKDLFPARAKEVKDKALEMA